MASPAESIDEVKARIELVSVDEAQREIASGVRVLDVREQNEWDESHLEGAIHVPQGEVAERIDELAPDRSERLLVHCRTDNRSARIVDLLGELGYEDAVAVEGGIVAWEGAGLPLVYAKGLTPEQRNRYSRHTLLAEVGVEGQVALLNAKVLLLGAGGLGSPTALYLAAAGVGTIGIVDDDVVDASNLQRQVIHTTAMVGKAKTASAKAAIEALNPDVDVIEHNTRLDASNILDLISEYDVIVDGADNFPTRYLLNDATVRLRKPVVSASILGFEGQISTFIPYEGPCYRCLYPT
ncbi:MAG: ThiF family adenylyltransferase, partial [Actinomycetota bacterium]|nr:ThiF family adenylyltransferase [Actinomycetota bacterium]